MDSAPAPLRVLLVQGDLVDAERISDMLRSPHVELTSVSTLADAVPLLGTAPVDQILLDLDLPDSKGLPTLQRMLEESRSAPVVVLTGHDDEQTALLAVAEGAQDYLVKSRTDASALLQAMRYAIQRNRALDALRTSEARLHAILQNALDAVVGMDAPGDVTRWNRRAEEIFGWTEQEAVGRSLADLIIPERDRQRHNEGLRTFLETGQSVILGRRLEMSALRRDGSEFPIELKVASRVEGEKVMFDAFIADITDRRAEQEAFQQLARNQELILASIGDGVHGLDEKGNISFQNAAAARMLGWKTDEIVGLPAHETIHYSQHFREPNQREECPIVRTIEDGEVRRCKDDLFWRKDGTSIRVEYVVSPKRERDGRITGAVVTFRDISHEKQMEEQVERAMRVSSIGRVAASVAHEFNNVLMGIQPFAELLQRKAVDPALARPIKVILEGVRRGQRVSQEILRFTHPAEPKIEPIDIAAWTREHVDELSAIVPDRVVTVSAAEPLVVRADVAQISQVLANLLTNARDATVGGAGIAVGAVPAQNIPFLCRCIAQPERFAALYVRDWGSGIPPAAREHIFEPLFTLKRQTGTGLGLAVCQQIAVAHGGEIVVESEDGSGSAFYVTLPLVASGSTSAATIEQVRIEE